MSLGERLRALRTENHLTQDELGVICDVTKGMVSQWEADIVQIPTERMIKMRNKLTFSCDWLLFGVGDMKGSMTEPVRALLRVAQTLPEYAVIQLTREGDTYAQLLKTGDGAKKSDAG